MEISSKIALDCRVSANRQTNEKQKTLLTDYAETNNFEYDLFEEFESSRNRLRKTKRK
jgi:hypothetical protein